MTDRSNEFSVDAPAPKRKFAVWIRVEQYDGQIVYTAWSKQPGQPEFPKALAIAGPIEIEEGDGLDVAQGLQTLLNDAASAIDNASNSYGNPRQTFHRISEFWAQVLGRPVSPAQVALCMIGVKMARLIANPTHYDSIKDIAGYAACMAEVAFEPVE